jgi:hypothetical protein
MMNSRQERSKRRKIRQKLKKKLPPKKGSDNDNQKDKDNVCGASSVPFERVSFDWVGFAKDGSGVEIQKVHGLLLAEERAIEGKDEGIIYYTIQLDDDSIFSDSIVRFPANQLDNFEFQLNGVIK